VGKTHENVFTWKMAISKANEKQETPTEEYEAEQEYPTETKEEKRQHVTKKQPEKSSRERGKLAKSEHPASGRAWWGNEYFDAKKRRWRKPARSPLWIVKLCLNLLILLGLGFLIVFGYRVFTQQIEPLKNAVILIMSMTAWILIIRLSRSRRFKWRKPSFKLTTFSVIAILLILSFAGVQPLSTYKDSLINSISTYFRSNDGSDTSHSPSDTTVSPATEINSRTGEYKGYYLGLVDTPGGYLSGNGCYDDEGDFIVLINNEDATDPSYSELVNFLQQDSTDQFPYISTVSIPGMYYGSAESNVDLENIQNIIDRTVEPSNPHVCADFAERLHNNAE
jgi:hypothetical protein